MIGYGGMLLGEPFVAIMALAAAVSLSPGIYFSMNTSTATMEKLAGLNRRRPACNTNNDPEHHCEKPPRLPAQARRHRRPGPLNRVGLLGRSGNPKTYTGAEALERLAGDVGEPNVVSRTGGAPTRRWASPTSSTRSAAGAP